MRAVQVEHADAPAAIAKDHEVLAEDAHAQRRPSRSRAKATGCQKRRRYSPPGVPGPTWVSSGSGAGVARRW